MTMPNFLVVGAPRAGTTALYYFLREHPDIFMSPIKETNFFAVEGEKIEFKGPGDHGAMNKLTSIDSIDKYKVLFNSVQDELAIGEVSPWYLYSVKAAKRIKNYIPEVKIIAILRHPVDRAYSNFLQAVRYGYEPIADFELAIKEEDKRINQQWGSPWYYKSRGFYHDQLKRYFDCFEEDKIKIYLYEDLMADPVMVLQDIFNFLGVDDTYIPNTSAKFNASGIPKNYLIDAALQKLKPFKKLLKQSFNANLVKALVDLQNKIQNSNLKKQNLSDSVRKRLIKDYYAEDIIKLQTLTKMDFSHWLK